jgi:hypothetical protein
MELAGSRKAGTNLLHIKLLLLAIATISGLGAYFLYLKLEELIHENRLMRQDLDLIRLENVRTMVAVRNKVRK